METSRIRKINLIRMSFANRVYAIKPEKFYLNKEAAVDNKFAHGTNMEQTEL